VQYRSFKYFHLTLGGIAIYFPILVADLHVSVTRNSLVPWSQLPAVSATSPNPSTLSRRHIHNALKSKYHASISRRSRERGPLLGIRSHFHVV
jgi:hypothetical protein